MNNINLLINQKRRDIPFKISLIYAFFSALWILFSDRILLLFIDDINFMTAVQTVKGWLFILITTGLIFNLLKREFHKVMKLEEMMIQTEKMLSINNLAHGMANQINNPLAGIAQSSQILKKRLLDRQSANLTTAESIGIDFEKMHLYMDKRDIERIIDSIISSSHNASEIIDSMLNFSVVNKNHNNARVDLEKLIDNTLELLLKDQNYSNAQIVRKYDKKCELNCEHTKLQQALFNILKNAMEAMTGIKSPPILQISLKKTEKRILIEIQDFGHGINDKIFSKIFDPFFTTKEGARGMGLAISNFIITEIYNGYINVSSHAGLGTTISVHIPIV